jgi:uncharacterized protein
MAQIFINLPVNDLDKSMAFYTAMGFTNNPQFSDDTAKCMVFSEHIFVMIMLKDRFQTFISKPIADLSNAVSSLLSVSVDSVEIVNTMIKNGLAAGGKEPTEAKDYGFMQQRSIEDMDGHTWEVFFMDMSKFPMEETAV